MIYIPLPTEGQGIVKRVKFHGIGTLGGGGGMWLQSSRKENLLKSFVASF